jgi:HupE / UreJ protein
VWPLAAAPPSSLPGFVRAGVHHVATGLDHLAFVLTLLLAVVIARDRDAVDGWRLRPLGAALRATALVASAFTLAHSLTLIAAALGWVAVPPRVVESVIALSIVWTALEDVVRPDVRWRFALTFGFGLVHGLGFARMLAVLLPPSDRVLPLLAFNLGVELAHLVVIAIVLPATWLIARRVGARRYRTQVLPIAAGLLAVVGLLWLAERVLGVALLGL